MKLSVIIPAYNEEKTILDMIERVRRCGLPNLEIVVVNDCSSDKTGKLLSSLPPSGDLKIFHHEVNKGKGAAIRTAQAAVTGDVVIIQDADLEYDPTDFPKLIQPLEEGRADAVFGSRYLAREQKGDTYFHYLGNHMLTVASNLLTGLKLTDMETCYKMIRRELFQSFQLECNRFGFEPEVTAKLSHAHARIVEIPIRYMPRSYQEGKKIGIKDAISALWYIVKYNTWKRR